MQLFPIADKSLAECSPKHIHAWSRFDKCDATDDDGNDDSGGDGAPTHNIQCALKANKLENYTCTTKTARNLHSEEFSVCCVCV